MVYRKKKSDFAFMIQHFVMIVLGIVLFLLATYVPWFTQGKDILIYQILSIGLSVAALAMMLVRFCFKKKAD